jgi:hypothetical protein
MAPDQTVSGTVTDGASGNPLSGATVSVKGGTKCTTTDAKGSFTICARQQQRSGDNYVGFETQELTVGNNTNLSISLASPGSTELNQVVVVGYGTQRKKDVTGSVKS